MPENPILHIRWRDKLCFSRHLVLPFPHLNNNIYYFIFGVFDETVLQIEKRRPNTNINSLVELHKKSNVPGEF